MIAATGWTYDYIDQHMTLPRLYAITGKWREVPPVHRMIADYFGVKRGQPASTEQVSPTGEKVNDWDALRGVVGFTVNG